MIDKSLPNAKPPQFGYFYLGNGYYLDYDIIGWLIGKYEEIRWGKDVRGYWRNRDMSRRWDNFFRCKLKIPYFIKWLENKRFNN